MIIGYARVSTADQNLDRQKDALEQYGIERLYCEKMSGTKKSRPELDRMLSELNEGDTVAIQSLSRLGRSTKHLLELVEELNKRNVSIADNSQDALNIVFMQDENSFENNDCYNIIFKMPTLLTNFEISWIMRTFVG